ncbi:hypothetical protein GCM10027605_23040 [Micromonospora zhanjiangensis]
MAVPPGLVVALIGAVLLIVLSPTGDPAAVPTGPVPADQAWAGARRAETPGPMPDGPAYRPGYFLTLDTSVGTAPTPDGRQLRLVSRATDGTGRELRRLPITSSPQFDGFVAADGRLAWAESTVGSAGQARVRLWTADLARGDPPRELTADTGAVAFFNADHDMVIADGRLHWVAVAPGDEPATEIRSVALTGGPVAVRRERGAWALDRWPWLVSVTAGVEPVRLRNLTTGVLITVKSAPTEQLSCGGTWCRVSTVSGAGPVNIDLMRPDGSDRRPVVNGVGVVSVTDVALLDRFEVYAVGAADASLTAGQHLMAYDLKTRRTVDIVPDAGVVQARAGVLWWSTGRDEATVWHAVDLRTIG